MPTSTFPLWWKMETIFQLLNAAREGASYQELDEITRNGTAGPGKFRAWVRFWRNRPQDRPQARLAAFIHSYDPPSSRESAAMLLVERAIAMHRELCECGIRKDDPDDPSCRSCALLEFAHNVGDRGQP